jgi:hypothetical protein
MGSGGGLQLGRLSRLEARLIEAVERAEAFQPSAADIGGGGEIRGEVLRAILLSTKMNWPGRGGAPWGGRAVKLTRFGIRVESATESGEKPLLRITGQLNLSEVAPADGGFLPPLHFEGCIFDESIELSGARIHSLKLRDCRFSRLVADGAHFAESVLIEKCGPRNPSLAEDFGAYEFHGNPGSAGPAVFSAMPPAMDRSTDADFEIESRSIQLSREDQPKVTCQISLRGAAIDVGLLIKQSYLRASVLRPLSGARSMYGVCALELSHAHIRDRVELVRSTFIGGARFVGVAVGDDLWIYGGKFIGHADRYALDFQFARIVGQLGVKGYTVKNNAHAEAATTFYPVVVIGQLSAIGLSAGEVWIAGGLFHGIDGYGNTEAPTLNFTKANVAGTFKLGLYHPHYITRPDKLGDRVFVHGEVSLVAATLGKNLEIHAAAPGDVREKLDLGEEYNVFFPDDGVIRVGASQKAGGAAPAATTFQISGEALKVDRRVNITDSEFCARTTQGGTSTPQPQEGPTPRLSSAIDLFKATIGTGLKIEHSCVCDGAVRLNSSVIGHEAIIACKILNTAKQFQGNRGTIPWLLDLRESTILGHLKIGRHTPTEPSAGTTVSGSAVSQVEGVPATADSVDEHAGTKSKPTFLIQGGISLESAKVQGSTTLRCLYLDLSAFVQSIKDPDGPGEAGSRDRARTALNMRDFTCGSGLEVHNLRWEFPKPSDQDRPAPKIPPYKNLKDEEGWHATIDLRGARCGLLSDDHGRGWGLIYRLRLRLAGFHVEEVEPKSDAAIDDRLSWLSHQNRVQPFSTIYVTPDHHSQGDPEPEPSRLLRTWNWVVHSLRHERSAFQQRRWSAREEDFVRHAYDVFAAANARAGEERAAEGILIERKNIQATLRYWRAHARAFHDIHFDLRLAAAAVVLAAVTILRYEWDLRFSVIISSVAFAVMVIFWPYVLGLLQLIARYAFKYGLSAERAMGVLAFCIIVGTGFVHRARYGQMRTVYDWTEMKKGYQEHLDPRVVLVLEVPYAPVAAQSVSYRSSGTSSRVSVNMSGKLDSELGVNTRQETKLAFAEPSPCNMDVNSFLYAADLFIPVLDLDQESKCGIRHDDSHSKKTYTWWRVAKAFYELLGWIVTSLVILVLSGVLRRDLERRVSSSESGEVPE